jgi:hypothetical protein
MRGCEAVNLATHTGLLLADFLNLVMVACRAETSAKRREKAPGACSFPLRTKLKHSSRCDGIRPAIISCQFSTAEQTLPCEARESVARIGQDINIVKQLCLIIAPSLAMDAFIILQQSELAARPARPQYLI